MGSIDTSKTLDNANFGSAFSGLNAGKLGTFFIGEGEGAVRIDYDITVIRLNSNPKVNSSDANVFMFYDAVSDRFVLRNKNTGATGITVHESSTWDGISSNKGAGNVLELMGLASPPKYIKRDYIAGSGVSISKGDYFKLTSSGDTSYWQALEDGVIGDPSLSSGKWRQVIEGVGRTINSEIGGNSSVRVNNGEIIYSKGTSFGDDEHGYKGINFDISNVSRSGVFDFTVGKDTSKARVRLINLSSSLTTHKTLLKV